MSDLSLNPLQRNWGRPFEPKVYETSASKKVAYKFPVLGLATEEVLQITNLDLDSKKTYTAKDFNPGAIYL